MQHLIILIAILIFATPFSAFAQESGDFKIRVIQDDGTVDEVNVRKPAPPPEPQQQRAKPRPPPQRQARAPRVKESDLVQPSDIQPSWAEQNIHYVPAEEEYEAVEPVEDQPPPTKTAYAPAPEEAGGWIPLPPRKPSTAPAAPKPGTISADLAANIALDNAPASQGFNVREDVYGGRHVFAVVFKTDSGPYEIMVDSANGDIVRRGEAAAPAPVQPSTSKWPVARR